MSLITAGCLTGCSSLGTTHLDLFFHKKLIFDDVIIVDEYHIGAGTHIRSCQEGDLYPASTASRHQPKLPGKQ